MKHKRTKLQKANHSYKYKKEDEDLRRAQVWSIDVMLAVVIFLSIILVFYVTLTANSNSNIDDLQTEAGLIRTAISTDSDLSFVTNSQVDNIKLLDFITAVDDDYDAVKQELGINSDFCIYYEDEQGNLILLNNTFTGVGSSNITVGGTPCNIPIS